MCYDVKQLENMEHNSNEDSGQSPGAIDICPVCDAIGMLCENYSKYEL